MSCCNERRRGISALRVSLSAGGRGGGGGDISAGEGGGGGVYLP